MKIKRIFSRADCTGRHAIVCLLAFLASLASGASISGDAQQHRAGEIRVQTNLVNILASVRDREGRPITSLPVDAFSVLEEGVPQTIARFEPETNQPLDLALMIDTSLSTVRDLKFEGDTAAEFVRNIVQPQDRLSVFEFSDEVLQLSDYSSNVASLQDALRRISAGAGTALYDAVYLGARSLQRGAADRRRVIVLVTDAGETTSKVGFDLTRQTAVASEALLYSIVIREMKSENGRNTAGEHALATITDDTGGAMYFPDDISELGAMFDQINRELRTQYLLGYYPHPTPPPATYRHVEVRVKGDYSVRSRREYLTAAASR
jgi:Ca-activated chloride channel homolog